MLSLEFFISSGSKFTPDEIKLSIEIEKIIFRINHSIHYGEPLKGATFSDIKKSLLSGTQYSDDFILNTLQKLENVEFNNKSIQVITKIRNKYFSLM